MRLIFKFIIFCKQYYWEKRRGTFGVETKDLTLTNDKVSLAKLSGHGEEPFEDEEAQGGGKAKEAEISMWQDKVNWGKYVCVCVCV